MMRQLSNCSIAFLLLFFVVTGCVDQDPMATTNEPSEEELAAIMAAGFTIENAYKSEDGSLWIENDINLTLDQLRNMKPGNLVEEQYRTDNLVNSGGARTITVYIPIASSGGRGKKSGGFSSTYSSSLDEAISRFNAENLEITFQRTNSTSADIVFTRLGKGDERRGVLGSAGFPSASGDPYGQIKMSGVLESSYGLGVAGIATIMAHEMGHCIGFRHTDYFDRSISCGGSPYNEGDGGVGAVHISGTPTGADLQGNGSWMLSCTDGSSRPFTNADKTALDVLY